MFIRLLRVRALPNLWFIVIHLMIEMVLFLLLFFHADGAVPRVVCGVCVYLCVCWTRCRSEKIGNTWPWWWIVYSYGFSRRPCVWAQRPLFFKRPLCMTIAFRSISSFRRLQPAPWAKSPAPTQLHHRRATRNPRFSLPPSSFFLYDTTPRMSVIHRLRPLPSVFLCTKSRVVILGNGCMCYDYCMIFFERILRLYRIIIDLIYYEMARNNLGYFGIFFYSHFFRDCIIPDKLADWYALKLLLILGNEKTNLRDSVVNPPFLFDTVLSIIHPLLCFCFCFCFSFRFCSCFCFVMFFFNTL